MCIFARYECGKIVAGTVRLFVAQCKGMLTACLTLKLPSILSFEQYYYFDGFWLRMLSVQSSSLLARMSRKDVTTTTYIQMDKDHLPLLEDQNPVGWSKVFAGSRSATLAFTEAIKSLSNVSGREAEVH